MGLLYMKREKKKKRERENCVSGMGHRTQTKPDPPGGFTNTPPQLPPHLKHDLVFHARRRLLLVSLSFSLSRSSWVLLVHVLCLFLSSFSLLFTPFLTSLLSSPIFLPMRNSEAERIVINKIMSSLFSFSPSKLRHVHYSPTCRTLTARNFSL